MKYSLKVSVAVVDGWLTVSSVPIANYIKTTVAIYSTSMFNDMYLQHALCGGYSISLGCRVWSHHHGYMLPRPHTGLYTEQEGACQCQRVLAVCWCMWHCLESHCHTGEGSQSLSSQRAGFQADSETSHVTNRESSQRVSQEKWLGGTIVMLRSRTAKYNLNPICSSHT